MSVNIYRKGQTPDLLEVANKGYNATWTGTKQAAEEALAKGEIKNGTVVYITDDYNTSDSVVHADTADKALVADRADTLTPGATDVSGSLVITDKKMYNRADRTVVTSAKGWDGTVKSIKEPGRYFCDLERKGDMPTNYGFLDVYAYNDSRLYIVYDTVGNQWLATVDYKGDWSGWSRLVTNNEIFPTAIGYSGGPTGYDLHNMITNNGIYLVMFNRLDVTAAAWNLCVITRYSETWWAKSIASYQMNISVNGKGIVTEPFYKAWCLRMGY